MNIICLGDSLMQTNSALTFPQEGWPQELSLFLADPRSTRVLNFACNGRSSKSFIAEGHFVDALEAAQAGDVVFISFGHNDEKEDPLRHSDPFSGYQDNLAMMARAFKNKGAYVVFITPMSRLQYDEDGRLKRTHGEYPRAMKEEAAKLKLDCIDLEELSYRELSANAPEVNRGFYMCLPKDTYPNYPEGLLDTSHLQERGAKMLCRLLVPEFKKIAYLKTLFV